MLIEIKNDTFNIAKRLQKIDSGYRVFYNSEKCCFEVWYQVGLNRHRELVLPYDSLDARTITKVVQSRVENIESIIKNLNIENENLQEKNNANLKDELNFNIKVMLKQY